MMLVIQQILKAALFATVLASLLYGVSGEKSGDTILIYLFYKAPFFS